MTWTRTAAATILAAALGWAAPGLAQDQPKDDDLDRILEKIDAVKPDEARKDVAPTPKPDPAGKVKDEAKPTGEVTPKDEAIDGILEKIGETKESPSPNGKPTPAKDGDEPPPPADPTKPKPEELKGQDKKIDDTLEALTGRRKKKQPRQGDGSGPLSDVIEKMREVEKRLGQPDTGEDTRKKEEEIVKKLDTILEQIRNASPGQGQGKKIVRSTKPGSQPGGKSNGQGTTPGRGQMANAKPRTPKDTPKSPGKGKDEWGHLQGELKVERDNAFSEKPLDAKAALVERYYSAVAKKGTSR